MAEKRMIPPPIMGAHFKKKLSVGAPAILFDMDGTLVDTEILRFRYLRSVLKAKGITLDDSYYLKMIGLNTSQFLHKFFHGKVDALEISRIRAEKWDAFMSDPGLLVQAVPGADSIIDYSADKGWIVCIVTGSESSFASKVIEYCGWKSKIDMMITHENISLPKPDPDAYLLARSLLDGGRAVVIEDSLIGVKASKAASLYCIAVPNNGYADDATRDELKSLSDEFYSTIRDIPLEGLGELLGRTDPGDSRKR